MQQYEVEMVEKIVIKLTVEAGSPEEAVRKAQSTTRYEFESVERIAEVYHAKRIRD